MDISAGLIVAFIFDRSDFNDLTKTFFSLVSFETLCSCASMITSVLRTAMRLSILMSTVIRIEERVGCVKLRRRTCR